MAVDTPSFSLAGFIVGFLIGQTGMGGGALMTPILILLFGIHPATAVGTDLLYASATKLVGTAMHGLTRTVAWRIVARLALGSMPATAATLLAIDWLGLDSPRASRLIATVLGLMLLATSVLLIFRHRVVEMIGRRFDRSPKHIAAATVFTGAVLGVLVTISSVGAGAIGVTVLLLLYPELPLPVIVGSDIAHAVPLTFLAGVGHWSLGAVDWNILIPLLAGSIPGIVLGSYLAVRVPEFVLRPLLAVTLLLVGARLLF